MSAVGVVSAMAASAMVGYLFGTRHTRKKFSDFLFAYKRRHGKMVWLKFKTIHYWRSFVELEKYNGGVR